MSDSQSIPAIDPAVGVRVAPSLATRARQLAARARAKSEDEKSTQDRSQTETALTKLNAELIKFEGVLRIHRALKAVGVPVEDYPALDKPAQALRARVNEVGRPAAQFLNARTRDLMTVGSAMGLADGQHWQTWAQAEVQKLPLSLVPRVSFVQRESTRKRIRELRAAAASAPNVAEVHILVQNLAAVRDELERVEGSDIDVVLDRFVNGRIRLADLTDEELALLRQDDSLSQQLYLLLP